MVGERTTDYLSEVPISTTASSLVSKLHSYFMSTGFEDCIDAEIFTPYLLWPPYV